MRTRLRNLLFCFLLLRSSFAVAQFKGGVADGNTLAIVSSLNLGSNIYTGGTDDGHAVVSASALALGRNIFIGGNDDGHALAPAAAQALGRNLYIGGIDDGHALALAPAQNLGRNIFLGGNDDGHTVTAAAAQALGRNIYTGGADDGWALAVATIVNLPITLSSFAGQWQQNDALLSWETETESNSDHFELQRSFDGSSFTAVATIAAAGDSYSKRSYQYTDSGVKSTLQRSNRETVYYRLRSVDKDGKDAYSGIVVLRSDLTSLAYSVFPNPARDVLNITVSGGVVDNNTHALLYDLNGRLLLQTRLTNNTQQLSVDRLPSGVYFLQLVTSGKQVYTQKIIIQK